MAIAKDSIIGETNYTDTSTSKSESFDVPNNTTQSNPPREETPSVSASNNIENKIKEDEAAILKAKELEELIKFQEERKRDVEELIDQYLSEESKISKQLLCFETCLQNYETAQEYTDNAVYLLKNGWSIDGKSYHEDTFNKICDYITNDIDIIKNSIKLLKIDYDRVSTARQGYQKSLRNIENTLGELVQEKLGLQRR